MHDAHAGGVGPERVDHLPGDEGGVGVHPGPPPQRASDQPGVGQRRLVAQLGVMERREVVHRDDRGGAPRGRHHEVRTVHDVGGTDEPFEWRQVPATPQGVQGPGRHRALVGGDACRQAGRDEATPAPAHRIGADLEARTGGEGGEGSLAEGADTGDGRLEQWRGVERDAQRRPLRGPGRADGAQVVIAPSMERIAPVT